MNFSSSCPKILTSCNRYNTVPRDRNLGVKALFLSSLICHHVPLILLHSYLLTLFSFSQPLFPGGLAGKEYACNVGDLGSISGLGRSPGEGKGYPLQYSGLENSMDCIVQEVSESDTTELLSLHFSGPIG